jgi:hypothetical protein
MLFFDLSDLFAERRLGDMQSVSGPREVQLFAQYNDCVQVPEFNVGEHWSTPLSLDGKNPLMPLSSKGTGKEKK